jgi:N-acetylglutamate synthase/N-acetylornithine aminotransferase
MASQSVPIQANLTQGTARAGQQTVDLVVVSGGAAMMTGSKPTINNQSPAFADLTAMTTAYNNLLVALRARGVIGGS